MFSMSAVCPSPLHCIDTKSFKKARHRLRELAPVAWHRERDALAFFDVSLERPGPQDVIRPRNHILKLLIRSRYVFALRSW